MIKLYILLNVGLLAWGQTCRYGAFIGGQCECWRGYKGRNCSVYDANLMPSQGSPAGMNLAGVNYYSTQFTFVDVMKTADWWVTQRQGQGWNTREHHLVAWREDGYPASLPDGLTLGTLVLRNSVYNPAGRYVVLYEGKGDLSFRFSARVVSRQQGRIELEVTPARSGVFLKIERTDTSDPVRNIRFLMPGFEGRHDNAPFHPMFLEQLRRYRVLRFMDWGRTNNHPEDLTWANRKSVNYYTQGGGPRSIGVAYEYMIQLSNILGASPWICIPHNASDDYVRNLATLIRDTLRPDLRVYVEWSNEVWNSMFRQHHYAGAEGRRLGFATRPWEAAWRYTAYRSVQVFNIFKEVFGPAARPRLEFILASQAANTYISRQIYSFQDAYRHADSASVAGYFCSHLGTQRMENWTLAATENELFENCTNSLNSKAQKLREQADMAAQFGLKLITYESGQHIVQASAINVGGRSIQNITEKFTAMNRSPRMKELHDQWLQLYKRNVIDHSTNQQNPGGLWVHFSSAGAFTRHGSWGVFEYTGQPYNEAIKYWSLQSFITDLTGGRHAVDRTCTFTETGAGAYGCFRRGMGQPMNCYQSQSRGRTWQPLPVINSRPGDSVVLDGVNQANKSVFVRLVNNLSMDTYLQLQAEAADWTRVSGIQYHALLADGNVKRSYPPADNRGLDSQAVNCI